MARTRRTRRASKAAGYYVGLPIAFALVVLPALALMLAPLFIVR